MSGHVWPCLAMACSQWHHPYPEARLRVDPVLLGFRDHPHHSTITSGHAEVKPRQATRHATRHEWIRIPPPPMKTRTQL